MKGAACWFPTALNGLTVLSAAAVWLYICNDTIFYHTGSTVRDVIVGLFTVCVFVQLLRALLPLLRRAFRTRRAIVPAVFCAGVLAVITHLELEQFLRRDVERHRADRLSYKGESDLAIMTAFTDPHFYFPPESFLEEARRTIPEDESVLYIGDIRPDPVNYALYPRPVYAIPELQRATLASAIHAWSRTPDPGFEDGFAQWLEEDTVDAEAIAESTRTLIRERDIRWAVIVDAFDAGRNRIVRLGGID